MSAAVSAYDAGLRDILILEREDALGGILKQCIHSGFGLELFGEELTGPEFAGRLARKVEERGIECELAATALDISPDRTVTATSAKRGIFKIRAGAIVLAMGCRERPRGALNIPGTRPAGIYTAGTAQRYVNIDGYLPGKKVVILGSGDIGLIMARRMTLEGAKVLAVCELMPYSGGLPRNIEQCLNDFNIPLLLSHTVTKIHGSERLTGVTISEVRTGPDGRRAPDPSTERFIECDTLLLSVGLIPENELSGACGIVMDSTTKGAVVDQDRETSVPGIFACGNVLHVHDLADFASAEAEIAGRSAAAYVLSESKNDTRLALRPDGKVRYTVPQVIRRAEDVEVYFRVGGIFPGATVKVIAAKPGEEDSRGEVILTRKFLKLTPGVMETVKLAGNKLAGLAEGTELRFRLSTD